MGRVKVNAYRPKEIGEYVSALANSAALVGKSFAHVVWGISDRDHAVVGTSFNPSAAKVGNVELENWLLRLLTPKINFRFFRVPVDGQSVVLLEIERAFRHPVRFRGQEYIRVGSYKKFDRKRKKKTSNREWVNPHDPEAKITKLKDGRTRLGHKVEEAVDLETGAVVPVTAPEELGDPQTMGDTRTMGDTLRMAREEVEAVGSGTQVREVVTDQGNHSNETVLELQELGLRGYLSKTDRGRRNWKGKNRKYQASVYANRRRIWGRRGRRLQRQRSELVERPFAHQFTTGGLRRIFIRDHANVRKRLLIHVCGINLGLLMRHLTGVGTSRSLQGRVRAHHSAPFGAKKGRWIGWNRL